MTTPDPPPIRTYRAFVQTPPGTDPLGPYGQPGRPQRFHARDDTCHLYACATVEAALNVVRSHLPEGLSLEGETRQLARIRARGRFLDLGASKFAFPTFGVDDDGLVADPAPEGLIEVARWAHAHAYDGIWTPSPFGASMLVIFTRAVEACVDVEACWDQRLETEAYRRLAGRNAPAGDGDGDGDGETP